MKVAVVLGVPPLVEGQAQGRTSVGLIRGLLDNGVDVRAYAARLPTAPAGRPPDDLPVEVIDIEPPPRGWRSRLAMVTDPLGHLAEGTFADRIAAAARSSDVVHLEEVSTAALAGRLEPPSVVHLHYLVEADRAWPRPWDKEVVAFAETVRAERRAVRANRVVLASSPVVADRIRGLRRDAEVVLAPLSLDPSAYTVARHDGPSVAGMIGTAWWPPSRSAFERLVGDVWPRVRAAVPDARLRLAGRGIDAIGLPREDSVDILGEVERAADFIVDLGVLLYPLTRGSGMKVKVLEALASGVPVVTTPSGAEGIGPHDGVVVESGDRALADAAAELLLDVGARRERGAAARRLFLERYAPPVATEPLVEAYARIVASGGR